MSAIGEKLEQILRENGAVLVGYGDVSDLAEDGLTKGVSVCLPMPKDMVRSIEEHVTEGYRAWYHHANEVLNGAINAGAAFLRAEGYKVQEYTTDKVVRTADNRTALPLKSIAVRAGLGWIGKSCLLVTPEYGSALRLSGLRTDAPLPLAEPMFEPKCGKCTKCMEKCPYDALKGVTWEKGAVRENMFDHEKCAAGAKASCLAAIGIEMTICGKCFVFCPYTRKYIKG